MRHRSRCLRPSKHRRGRSARKAAPAPKPVGAARSGRSLLGGVQPVSRLPGKQGSAWWQVRSRGTPLQLLRSEVASVWRGRDHCGFGAIAPGKEQAPIRDRSRMFSRRRNSRAGSSIDSLNRVRFRAIFAAVNSEVTNKLRVLPHSIHVPRHNESEACLLGTLSLSVRRRRVSKRRLFRCPLFCEQSEDCKQSPFTSRAGLFVCDVSTAKSPVRSTGDSGLVLAFLAV